MRRLGGVAGALAVTLTVLAAFPGPARASWTVPGHGLPATAAAAVTMPAGVSPTVTGTGTAAARTFTVSWTAPTPTCCAALLGARIEVAELSEGESVVDRLTTINTAPSHLARVLRPRGTCSSLSAA